MRRRPILPSWIVQIAVVASFLAACTPSGPIVYRNEEYGFSFTLPATWRGYTIVLANWDGFAGGAEGGSITQTGPLILIRHPQWTAAVPRQDIPIMVFTPSEWDSVQAGNLIVSAAPVPPTELGQNANYVFALPARYNYAFPPGWQEVEQILAGSPLQAP